MDLIKINSFRDYRLKMKRSGFLQATRNCNSNQYTNSRITTQKMNIYYKDKYINRAELINPIICNFKFQYLYIFKTGVIRNS